MDEFPDRHFGTSTVRGLVAQDVEQIFPELVGTDARGFKTVDYGIALQMLSIQAIKELNAKIADVASSTASQMETLNAQVNFGAGTVGAEIAASSFASASATLRGLITGLGDIIVETFHNAIYAVIGIFDKVFAGEVHTDKLCVSDDSGETCITKAQLDALLAGQTASAASVGTTDLGVSPPSSAPTISINGNNPATI